MAIVISKIGYNTLMDKDALYQAFASRDPRFDGIFYVGVTSTGIYCRPVCTAKFPKMANCKFFKNAEAAEKAGFRPCLRCRPELAPGNAPIDEGHEIAHLLLQQEEDLNLESISKKLGLSSRQIRRIVQKEFGVSPIELLLTRRLLLAKQLLTETTLPIIDVAFASGFSSLRRFNDAFKKRYGMPPSSIRKERKSHASDKIRLQLNYRPPYDWNEMLNFMRNRVMAGVEYVGADFYMRTVQIDKKKGWIRITHEPQKNTLIAEISTSLNSVLFTLLAKLRHMFDLHARPDKIASHLSQDPQLAQVVSAYPGLRLPGAFNGFELAVRAILGQQITVKAATTLSCRFVKAFGEPFQTPFPELCALSPTPKRIASASIDEIASLGIIRSRTLAIIELARLDLHLDPTANVESTIHQLTSIPGIGLWTAHYIAMRALRWPDAFPKEDIALRKSLGRITAKQAEILSQAWRPWRSYATLYLWKK